MQLVIIVFGDLMLLVGLLILARPDIIFGFLQRVSNRIEFYVLAIFVRLSLGFLLISQAGVSSFPRAIEIIGWIALAAGLGVILMRRRNFERTMNRALELIQPIGRIGGLIAAAFGAFLVLSFV